MVIVVNMQKSLNYLDSAERNLNIIISGLSEGNITTDTDDDILENDFDKMCYILDIMECKHFSADMLSNLKLTRIGKSREGYPRILKISFTSKIDRDEFVKDSKKLKNANGVWKKVFVKKDEHYVYREENIRMKLRYKAEKDNVENQNKTVDFKNGKITVDGKIVDQNTFFSK